jgi:DNA-binding protein YbaB
MKVAGTGAGASGYVWDDLDSAPSLASLRTIMAGVGKLLKQAQKMQRGIAEAQQQLAAERLEVSHGGGAIRVTVDGHGLVHGLTLDPEFLKEEKSLVEQALVLALQEASAKARVLHETTMSKATAGFSLPGM